MAGGSERDLATATLNPHSQEEQVKEQGGVKGLVWSALFSTQTGIPHVGAVVFCIFVS